MTKKVKTLPQYPSELIRIALDDLKKVEKDSRYVVDMRRWHMPDERRDPCSVCLAGSVIAKTFNEDPRIYLSPSSYDIKLENKLLALNYFRVGDVSVAFTRLAYNNADYCKKDFSYSNGGVFDRNIESYTRDRKQFHKDMRKLARDLERAGY